LEKFDKNKAFKLVCHSKASLTNAPPTNIFCKNDAKLKIFDSKSGLQNKDVCFQFSESKIEVVNGCEETIETTKILREKFDF
jgi:hypothetical protein